MSYVYLKSESELWTVGFYEPSGRFHPESDHESEGAAAARVHYLNGGSTPAMPELVENAKWANAMLRSLTDGVRTDVLEGFLIGRERLALAIAKAEGGTR